MVTPIEHYFSFMMAPTIDSERTYAWFSGLNHPIYNSVIRFSEGDIDALISTAPKGAPISFWITPSPESEGLVKSLKERGFEKLVSCPSMSWEVKQIELPKAKIEQVNQETRKEFYRILFSVNQFNEQLSGEAEKLLMRTPVEDYLIYSKDLPVGTATLFVDGQIGVIFNVTVLPEYQKSGYGSAVMQYAMHRAHELGLKTLILNSSQAAIKMYTTLGFEQKSDLEMYTRKTSACCAE
jgi:N-acetylglutamate synthase-like GNAT family acetyltransferase